MTETTASARSSWPPRAVRTFCYGFLGILLPLYLASSGVMRRGIGLAVTCTLVGQRGAHVGRAAPRRAFRRARRAARPRRPLRRSPPLLLLVPAEPWLVVARGHARQRRGGHRRDGPVPERRAGRHRARGTAGSRRTTLLSVYNLLGYARGRARRRHRRTRDAPRRSSRLFLPPPSFRSSATPPAPLGAGPAAPGRAAPGPSTR